MTNRGFSLLEVMITAGIMSVLALGISFVTVNAMKGSNLGMALNNYNDAVGLAAIIIDRTTNGCNVNVAGTTFDTAQAAANPLYSVDINPAVQIAYPPPTASILIAKNQLFGNQPPIKITGISLRNFRLLSATSYSADINIQASVSSNAVLGPNVINGGNIPVQLTVTTAGTTATIASCGAPALSLGSLNCKSFEGGVVGNNSLASLPCPPSYPYAMSGGCNGP